MIRRLPPGSRLELELLRSGERVPLTLTLGSRPSNASLLAQGNAPNAGGSENVLTVDEFAAIWRDNEVAAKARFIAMGILTITGRADKVTERGIHLVGTTEEATQLLCGFTRLPWEMRSRGYQDPPTPPEAMRIRKGDLVTVRGRYKSKVLSSVWSLSDTQILSIVPAAQIPRAEPVRPQMPNMPQESQASAPGAPPAGYYQCYNMQLMLGFGGAPPTCKTDDFQIDGRGNYISTTGASGNYVFDPTTNLISFSGGILNGRLARAGQVRNAGPYRIRMTPSGNGLPSPNQNMGVYSYEYMPSRRRE